MHDEGRGTSESVLVTRDGPVMLITLNRPEVSNAVDLEMTVAIGDALEEAHRDDGIRAVIITGAGDRAFCAGVDLRARASGEQTMPSDPPHADWGFAGFVRHRIDKPTIAAVNGAARAGGAEIVLASDLAVASTSASLGFPELKVGLFAGAGGAFRLPQYVGPKVALEILLTGEPIPAARARDLGLVNRVVEPGDLLAESMDLAHRIAGYPPIAVAATIRVARGIVDRTVPSEEPGWQQTMREVERIEASQEAQEGAAAFAQKRPPRFTPASRPPTSRSRMRSEGSA